MLVVMAQEVGFRETRGCLDVATLLLFLARKGVLSLQAPLPGPKQTVPRAEISALIEVLNHSEGDIVICSDCKHVVDIFNKGASTCPLP